MRNPGMMGWPGLGEGSGPFAWLERIENGTLVHYQVAVKRRLPSAPMAQHGSYGPSALAPGELMGARAEEVIETCQIASKTVYCKDLQEVENAVAVASQAQQEILALEKDGKFEGPRIATA